MLSFSMTWLLFSIPLMQVENYNFHGFPAPTLGLLIHICTSIESWLCEDASNVAVVHCYVDVSRLSHKQDGKGRTMVVCACVMAWMGWFNSPAEALAICLDRRGLDETAVLPSQQRTLQYFDSLLQGVRPSPAGMQLTEVTVSHLPDMGQGVCCPSLEVYCQDHRVFVSRGNTLKAGESVSFAPNVVLRVSPAGNCHLGNRVVATASYSRGERLDAIARAIPHRLRETVPTELPRGSLRRRRETPRGTGGDVCVRSERRPAGVGRSVRRADFPRVVGSVGRSDASQGDAHGTRACPG